jgi:formamidopyrimidine-DNA glycosylase
VPERPDLAYVIPKLREALIGARIAAVTVLDAVIPRVSVAGDLSDLVRGRTITDVSRRTHFVCITLDGPAPPIDIVVSPMLAGRFAITDAPVGKAKRKGRAIAVVVTFDDGRELQYRDDVRMGKFYVAARDSAATVIPGYADAGLDVLNAKQFTRAAFRKLARTRRDQVRVFLMDRSAIDAFGNAYADEVLFEAMIHPKAWVRALSDDELERLRKAAVTVLKHAIKEITRRKPPLDEKLRDFLKVRGRAGQPCHRCGATIRVAGVRGYDSEFCPVCQPDDRRSSLIDWREVS